VHKLREAPARERYLTDEEEKRLFAILVGRRAHLRPIVVVALQTGMRQGEILGLKWENVDFEQGTALRSRPWCSGIDVVKMWSGICLSCPPT